MTPRPTRRRRLPVPLGAALLLLLVAGLAALDRAGAFGPSGDDFARYHNRTFTVSRVVDGDTLDLAVRDGRHRATRVRLWGVDTPETVDPRKSRPDYFGPQASTYASELAAGRVVRVELVQGDIRDRHGRLLAYVFLPDGSMLNELILQTGHGYADLRFRHPRFQRFRTIEQRARRAEAGLWAAVRPDQWPDWRRDMLGPDDADLVAVDEPD